MGLAWILYIVWNAINDPLIGYLGDRIKLNIGLIPAIFFVLATLVLIKFPIDGSTAEYKEMKNRLEKLHDEKLESFLRLSTEE